MQAQERMIAAGIVRTAINRNTCRIVAMFKWGVRQELIPPTTHQALMTVGGLRRGRSKAAEADPVRPVPEGDFRSALDEMTPTVAAICRLLHLTGMRVSEARLMVWDDVDRSVNPWRYEPASHKTAYHGKRRIVFLGPQAQLVLRPYLADRGFVFRSNPMFNRPYTLHGLGASVYRACDVAGVDRWSPGRLRATYSVGSLGAVGSTLLLAGRITLIESLGGILIGGTLAITAALIASCWGVAGRALIPFAVAFNAVPTIIFAPIMNNWFGTINPLSNMMVVVTLVYYPIMINVYRGLTRLDRPKLELMQSLGASERDIFTKLRLPNALPYFFNALKLAATLSVIGTVVAGYFGGPLAALGVWILNQAVYFKFTSAWAGIAVACAIGIFFYLVITIIEHRVISWHESIRSGKQ